MLADDSGSPPARPGLVATYSDGKRAVVVRTERASFYLEPDESIHPALEPSFEAEWTGFISILEGGPYTLRSGEAKVYLDGKRWTGTLDLDAGHHPVRITYRRAPGAARLALRWESEQFPEEPVPASVFFSTETTPELREQSTVERGRFLIEEFGCTNCHVTSSPSLEARRGPDLSRIGARTGMRWIYWWLEDPSRFRTGAVMPAMLDAAGRRDVAAYLATLGRNDGDHGGPAEETITPHAIGKGEELYGSIGCQACHDLPGLSLEGLGSKTSWSALSNYLLDPGAVDPSARMPSLLLTSDEARQLAAFLVESRRPEFEEAIPGEADADPRRGRRLLETTGCLGCHRLNDPHASDAPKPPEAISNAPPLATLQSGAEGCLATTPRADLPRYRLTKEEREALSGFIAFYRKTPDFSAAPVYTTERRLRQLRCTACHRRGGAGPDAPIVERVPSLTGVGAKLKTAWIGEVLTNERRARPELRIRMPDYPDALGSSLARGLAAADGLGLEGEITPPPSVAPRDIEAWQAAGVDMIGSDGAKGGLSCIACHDYGEFRPVADEKGPQIIGTTERIRFDWFRRWMHNPGRIVSGTSMPTFFSEQSRREADEAIARLWTALALGSDMPRPYGVGLETLASGSEMFPMPTHSAVLVRFPLPGATAAAIAVGMPRQGKTPGISYCFDAATCHLVFAWQGGFLDLSGSLGKQMAYPRLLGEIFYRMPWFPLRIGVVDRIPSRRFRGYRIVEGFPEFRYEVDGIEIHERIVPLRPGSGFVHELRFERVDNPAWFVVDADQAVEWTSTVGEFSRDERGEHGARGLLEIPRGENVRLDVRVRRLEEGDGTAPEEELRER